MAQFKKRELIWMQPQLTIDRMSILLSRRADCCHPNDTAASVDPRDAELLDRTEMNQ
jgi:hypothetical protein